MCATDPRDERCARSSTATASPPWPPSASTTPRTSRSSSLYSHAVDAGEVGCSFDQHDAERFARALLMPREAFAPVLAWSDLELAELFAAPLDQVARRRGDDVARR
jgi:hypothetical protein